MSPFLFKTLANFIFLLQETADLNRLTQVDLTFLFLDLWILEFSKF